MSVIDEIKNKAKTNKKTVVLPETTDMRTLTAAAEVISEGIADIILVGKEDEIKEKQKQKDWIYPKLLLLIQRTVIV